MFSMYYMIQFAPGRPDLALQNQQVLEKEIYQFHLHKPHVAIEETRRLKVHEIQGCAASCYRVHIRKELSKQRRGKYCSHTGDRSKITKLRMTEISFRIATAYFRELGSEENEENVRHTKLWNLETNKRTSGCRHYSQCGDNCPSFGSWFQAAPRSPLSTAAEIRKIPYFRGVQFARVVKPRSFWNSEWRKWHDMMYWSEYVRGVG